MIALSPQPPTKAKLAGSMTARWMHSRYFFSHGSIHPTLSLPTLPLGGKGVRYSCVASMPRYFFLQTPESILDRTADCIADCSVDRAETPIEHVWFLHEAREPTKSNESWVIGASATEAPITNFHFTPHLCTPARVVLARGGGPCARESFSEFNRQSRDYQHSLFSVPIRACMTAARHIASLRRGWRTRQT